MNKHTQSGFTLIETLVAITVLTIAVAAPLTLAAQSLLSAFSARDQVTAFHLAQEALETVRAQRDHNVLQVVQGDAGANWLYGFPVQSEGEEVKPFIVDSLSITHNFEQCPGDEGSSCNYLQFNPTTGFYGHENGNVSKYKRFVTVTEVPGTNGEEVRVRAEVQWRAGTLSGTRSVVVENNLYKWVAGLYTAP